MTAKTRTVASLFSGAGGFDWGFHRAGFKTHLAVELKQSPAETLASNFSLDTLTTPCRPQVGDLPAVIQGDVRDVDFSGLVKMQPDVLIGGPPCQDFSISKGSKREGLNGGRGKLYLEFLRALMFLQPKMFVFENVPGFTSANNGLAYQTVLDDLRELETHRLQAHDTAQEAMVPEHSVDGFTILFSSVVDTPAVGVSQTRRRLIIIGLRNDLMSDSQSGEFEQYFTNVLTGSDSTFRSFPMTPLEIFEGQPLHKLGERYKQVMRSYGSLGINTVFEKAVRWRQEVFEKLTFDVIKDYYSAIGLNYADNHDTTLFRQVMADHEDLLRQLGWLGRPVSSLSDPLNALPKQSEAVRSRMYHIPPEENAEFVDGTEWQVSSKEISFIYRRPSPLKPAWTVMAYGGGGTYGYHYERERQMLTLRERARVQTFSDDFTFKGSQIRAQIGEAVPPLLGERIAQAVDYVLNSVE